MAEMRQDETVPAAGQTPPLIYRQFLWTRITHWTWAIALFFLLLSGLQIFNAHPALYVGKQSGFGFDNEVLAIRAENTPDGPVGYTRVLGVRFDTTGVLGLSGQEARPSRRGFPAWATIMMLLLVGFFVVHMLMILAAGPLNELRSIISGWYRVDPPAGKG